MATVETKRQRPEIPDVESDRTVAYMLKVAGPDEIMTLATDASEDVRDWLRNYSHSNLDQLRFESLILPWMFEARRLGELRGIAKCGSMFAGLFPEESAATPSSQGG